MSDFLLMHIVRVAAFVFAGVIVPAVGWRAFASAIADRAPRVRNYRGVDVPVSLWAVWVFWALGVITVFLAADIAYPYEAAAQTEGYGLPFLTLAVLPMRALWPTLVLGVVLVGLADDLFGSGDARGFRGHLGAVRRGRVTTGVLKVLGIGVLAAGAAGVMSRAYHDWVGSVGAPAWVAIGLSTLVIALAANLANLLDVRPGRLAKVHVASSLVLAALVAAGAGGVWSQWTAYAGSSAAGGLLTGAAMFAIWAGPMLVIWREDHGERGMLGDAGSNPAGALLGLALAGMLDETGLAIAATLLLGLNLASERVSFSQVIERVAVLRWLDGLGRAGDTGGEADAAASDETPDIPDER